jgi:homoserine dehydrogenase
MQLKKKPLIITGLGRVGREVTRQLLDCRKTIEANSGAFFSILALADSRAVIGDENGLSEGVLVEALSKKESGLSLNELPGSMPLASLSGFIKPDVLLADTSASVGTAHFLADLVEKGGAVALANKLPLVLPWKESGVLFNNPQVRYEATVGAGLPVIAALKDLVACDDEVTAIEGCMSGTLGFICSQLEQGKLFSDAVLAAFQSGYTEPDPRQDLGGLDVARKALILARTAGFMAEMKDIEVESLYLESQAGLSIQDFLKSLSDLNARFQARAARAKDEGKVMRYMAHVTPRAISVGLTAIERNSVPGILQGPDNYFAIHTRRYNASPLVISGPGAGIQVTAAGVINDLIHLANSREME